MKIQLINIWGKTKNIMSKNIVSQIKQSTKDSSINWILLFIVEILVSTFINIIIYVVHISQINSIARNMINTNVFALCSKFLIMKIVLFLLITFCIWLFVDKIIKSKCSYNNICNLCATVLILHTIISVIAMIIGLAVPFMANSFAVVNKVLLVILMYIGLKDIVQDNDNNIFWKFIGMVFVVSIILNLMSKVITDIEITLI